MNKDNGDTAMKDVEYYSRLVQAWFLAKLTHTGMIFLFSLVMFIVTSSSHSALSFSFAGLILLCVFDTSFSAKYVEGLLSGKEEGKTLLLICDLLEVYFFTFSIIFYTILKTMGE